MKKIVGIMGMMLLYGGTLGFGEPGIAGAVTYLGICLCLSATALAAYPLLSQVADELEVAYHLRRQKEIIQQKKLAHEMKENTHGVNELLRLPVIN